MRCNILLYNPYCIVFAAIIYDDQFFLYIVHFDIHHSIEYGSDGFFLVVCRNDNR